MNMKKFRYACYMLVSGLLATPISQADEPRLTRADFEELHTELTAAKEPWQAIPWRLSLLEACAQAAKDNKPVYMLARAGHPLGCV